ncbi:hypothetical protein DFH08DRAFT_948091 [Mycena albidolilacea]|uniref:Uncharacterized protein n=1 Tax=Mycena albidolilacea TaxID=1033008 RepID=A0AAD7AQ68_9AGAR|nr:hypothetical protein DFH08DRAFT_948091 [Mycena albidolilacea]
MSLPSVSKRCTVIGLHPVPAHLSTKEFAAKIEVLADYHLSLPVAQENFIKYDLITPSDRFDSHFKALGFPQSRPAILVKVECKVRFRAKTSYAYPGSSRQSTEHFAQFLRDAEVVKSISGAPEFAGATMHSMDGTMRIDNGSTDGSGSWISIVDCAPHLSRSQFSQKSADVADGITAVPIMQKNLVRHTMWVGNEALDIDVQALGLPPAASFMIAMLEADLDPMIQALKDNGLKQFFNKLPESSWTDEFSNRFAVDVVTKLDRL